MRLRVPITTMHIYFHCNIHEARFGWGLRRDLLMLSDAFQRAGSEWKKFFWNSILGYKVSYPVSKISFLHITSSPRAPLFQPNRAHKQSASKTFSRIKIDEMKKTTARQTCLRQKPFNDSKKRNFLLSGNLCFRKCAPCIPAFLHRARMKRDFVSRNVHCFVFV